MSRRRPPQVPTCPRCGNEEDLREWYNGVAYCETCITCPHGRAGVRGGACHKCVQKLHTVMTFEGPRITDLDYYVEMAWTEYSVPVDDLLTWSYTEQGVLNDMYDRLRDWQKYGSKSFGVTAPPPHHRFTSWGGSR